MRPGSKIWRYTSAPLSHALRTEGLCCCFVDCLAGNLSFLENVKAEPGPAGNVVSLDKEAGRTSSLKEIQNSLEQHKPAVLFLCQVSMLMSRGTSDHQFGRFLPSIEPMRAGTI